MSVSYHGVSDVSILRIQSNEHNNEYQIKSMYSHDTYQFILKDFEGFL